MTVFALDANHHHDQDDRYSSRHDSRSGECDDNHLGLRL